MVAHVPTHKINTGWDCKSGLQMNEPAKHSWTLCAGEIQAASHDSPEVCRVKSSSLDGSSLLFSHSGISHYGMEIQALIYCCDSAQVFRDKMRRGSSGTHAKITCLLAASAFPWMILLTVCETFCLCSSFEACPLLFLLRGSFIMANKLLPQSKMGSECVMLMDQLIANWRQEHIDHLWINMAISTSVVTKSMKGQIFCVNARVCWWGSEDIKYIKKQHPF